MMLVEMISCCDSDFDALDSDFDLTESDCDCESDCD